MTPDEIRHRNGKFGDTLRDWPKPLRRRRAGANLDCLIVYDDHHACLSFRGGKKLAEDLRNSDECPSDKTPALLLTKGTDKYEAPRVAGDEYITVIDVDLFLARKDSYAEYAALHSGATAEQLGGLSTLGPTITLINIQKWLREKPARRSSLLRVIDRAESISQANEPDFGNLDDSDEQYEDANTSKVINAFQVLGKCGPDTLDALITFLTEKGTRQDRLAMLRAVMASPDGCKIGGQAFAESISFRLSHLEAVTRKFQQLLPPKGGPIPESTETAMQKLIQEELWLLSLDHAEIIPQASPGVGDVDYYVRRYDGKTDLIEMKGPGDDLVKHLNSAKPGVPHEYKIGSKLNNAVAQAISYRIQGDTRNPFKAVHTATGSRIYVVIGRVENMEQTDRRVFEDYRMALHGIEIIAYDEVAKRAFRRMENIRECLKHPQLKGKN